MNIIRRILILSLIWTVPVAGASITGFNVGINWTGYDPTGQSGGPPGTPFTYEPLDGNTGQFKAEYVNAVVNNIYPVVGRDMDLKYGNDSTIQTWSQQIALASDYTPFGARESTSINIANQMVAKIPTFQPQITMPLKTDDAYAEQQGFDWAQKYKGRKVRINLGNEVFVVFQGNLGQWNLQQARAEGYQGDDFRVLGLRQGVRLGQHSIAFRKGWSEGGGDPNNVTTVIEGFSPVTQYAQNQIDGMRSVGIEPKTLNGRLSIAQYGFGSATDPQGAPLGTDAQKETALDSFGDNEQVVWTAQHAALAKANGLDPHVDAYEMREATKPVSGAAETADWVNFNKSDAAQRVQEYVIPRVLSAAGGVGAILNVEGYGGFPMSARQGQFPLVDIPDMFTNPEIWGAYRGVHGLIDFSASVPEPGTLAVIVTVVAAMLLSRRRRVAA